MWRDGCRRGEIKFTVAGQVFDLIELSQDYVENPARDHKVEKHHPEGGKTFDVLSIQRENGDDK